MVFTDIFIKRPVLSVVVSLLILLIGLRAATVLPIRQYPKLSNTVVNVTTSYPGASADLIQGFITTPIEQAVASAEGVDYMTSSSVLADTLETMKKPLDWPAAAWKLLAAIAAETSPGETLRPAIRTGSSHSRIANVWPPRMSADATPSTVESTG